MVGVVRYSTSESNCSKLEERTTPEKLTELYYCIYEDPDVQPFEVLIDADSSISALKNAIK